MREKELTCKDCLHVGICGFHLTNHENKECKQFIPAADVVEVKYGRWVEMQETIPWCEDDVDTFYVCSVCKCRNYAPTQYCPDCGAKMEAE